ncbi:hypothetical protein GCM10017783_00830 [Deinococcus piscis]|uniref:Sec-independent protein translocase protein TatA n=2 Tax=Deinococcus piscis TaxID=394230 RepID=A0ABQ3JX93_9DEIO|nr:hypothetical protein GCM10017783_00830 [Deinococcus piscis]
MEILFILVVALVLFGPTRLPELGKSLGKGIREFRRGTQGLKDELELSMKDAPAQSQAGQPQHTPPTQAAPMPAAAPAQPAPNPAPAEQVVYSAVPGEVAADPAQAPSVQPAQPLRASDLAVAPVVETPADPAPQPPAAPSSHRA